ncbi:MAG: energy transducer TonB [Acidobacteriota bacterium]
MEKKIRKYTIIVSIVLHIIIFFAAEKTINFRLLGTEDLAEEINEPIVFDLSENENPKQVIETTEDQRSEKKSEKPEYFSDKNTIARNPDPPSDLKEDAPYSKGDLDVPSLPKITKEGKPEDVKEKTDPEKEKSEKKTEDITDAISESKEEAFEVEKRDPGESIRNQILHRNILAKVKELGGFAFNTYDWNFAPYMLELKRLIQSNIFPPIAFTQLGMISGETLLRFRIYPDGRLEALELLNTKGHKSLVETSVNAVEISDPFPELPDDFPKPFLEVTGKFIYFIRK